MTNAGPSSQVRFSGGRASINMWPKADLIDISKIRECCARIAHAECFFEDIERCLENLEAFVVNEDACESKLKDVLDTSLSRVKKNEKAIYHETTNLSRLVEKNFVETKYTGTMYKSVPERGLLEGAILDHLIRTGHDQAAKLLAEECSSIDTHAIKVSERAELPKYFESIRNQGYEALKWADEYAKFLSNRGSKLRNRLIKKGLEDTLPRDLPPMERLTEALRFIRQTLPSGSSHTDMKFVGELLFRVISENSVFSEEAHQPENLSTLEELTAEFSREFHASLCLALTSPLYTAFYASRYALPVCERMKRLLTSKQSSSTVSYLNKEELPVEIPLPSSLCFHPIFVCPISKEQTNNTTNPPMLLPCGHVISKSSLEIFERSSSYFKCPTCPVRAHAHESVRICINH